MVWTGLVTGSDGASQPAAEQLTGIYRPSHAGPGSAEAGAALRSSERRFFLAKPGES